MLHKSNFIEIFNDVDEKTGVVTRRSIIIPIIQRDYAQGRDDEQAIRVREKFLQALYNATVDSPITLDFIYGNIDKEKNVITLLDGQQRITTLFLLYWYAAKKAGRNESEYDFLKYFSYETRYSSRIFCANLVNYTPDFSVEKISEDIEDQSWFALGWKNDPTIKSMLRMIDAINDKFKDVPELWERLKSDAITFYFLPIENMGLTDELYIKMNSRGKPLSEFENFKAELEGEISKYDKNKAIEISRKIDGIWTDLLWNYKDFSNTIDTAFLNLFRIICQIIAYKNEQSFSKWRGDSFDLLDKYFNNEKASDYEENLRILETFFDNWYGLNEEKSLGDFFNENLSFEHDGDKIKYSGEIDVFKDCTLTNSITLPKLIFFYAFMVYVNNRDAISEKDFRRRLRVVNNLILNSSEEMSDLENRAGGNRMPAILRQVDSIILSGKIDKNSGISFNANQLEEESEKLEFTARHPELAESLFKLEDHELLNGQIAIVGLLNHALFDRFSELFKCNFDKINRAMIAIGDYSQQIGRDDIYQLGAVNSNNAWRNLFHKSARNSGFEKTREVLIELLNRSTVFSDELLDTISNGYVDGCVATGRFDWRYYFIKYTSFRPDPKQERFYGKYFLELGYSMYVMVTEKRVSENAYCPFIKEVLKNVSNAVMGRNYNYDAHLDILHIQKDRVGYRFSKDSIEKMEAKIMEDGYYAFETVERIKIKQDENGVDTEDRIEKLVGVVREAV